MKGFRVWGLATSRIIALLIVLFVFLYPIPYTLYPTFAADSTPSADIKIKLEELKKEIASKAAKLKQEVNRKLKDKAYVGLVKAISETSLTLAAESGPKIVSINQDTVFESKIKSKQKFSQKSLSEENYVATLGDIDETGVLTAKKIILLPDVSSEKPKAFLWGQAISISDKLITLKSRDFKNVAASLPAESKVSLNDFVILTGNMAKNDIFKARFVYVIPQGGIIKPKKVVTPSAQTATKSATSSGKKK